MYNTKSFVNVPVITNNHPQVFMPSITTPGKYISFIPYQDDMSHEIGIPVEDDNKTYIMYFDVEATAPLKPGQMTEFAFVLVDITNGVIEDYFKSYLPLLPYSTWDTNTLQEFWYKHPTLYYNTLFFCRVMIETEENIAMNLSRWLRYHSATKKYNFASDNPAHDAYWINRLLSKIDNLFTITGVYKPIIDLRSWSAGVMGINVLSTNEALLKKTIEWVKDYYSGKGHRLHNTNIGPDTNYCHGSLTDAIRGAKIFFFIHNSKKNERPMVQGLSQGDNWSSNV